MKYEFPKIKTIDDVLPHIDGLDEFCVMDKGYAKIIQYNVITPTTFPDVTDYASAIRRECRGIAFYSNGAIMSRPFHKFFNVNEKAETQLDQLDFSNGLFMDKLDGSMIRPIWFQNMTYRLGTKRGVTDTSKLAEEFMVSSPLYKKYHNLIMELGDGYTPIFEFCSNKMRIILPYPEEKMVLLAIRNNATGEYVSRHVLEHVAEGVPVVAATNFNEPTPDIMDKIRASNDSEGYVVSFGQHMVKIKSDWYVDLHKAKEQITHEKYVIAMILEERLDDLLPRLLPEDAERVINYQMEFGQGVLEAAKTLYSLFDFVLKEVPILDENMLELSASAYAREFAMALKAKSASDPEFARWENTIFKMRARLFEQGFAGHTAARELILDRIKRSIATQKTVDKNRFLWNNVTYNYGETE